MTALRGHGPKIAEAVQALRTEGRWPQNLRPGERDRRMRAKLAQLGYAPSELPSRASLDRHLKTHIQSGQLGQVAE